ncbi:MAG: helix-turn-helix domain-containing protein [Steroidobacteraceae bacterium]
MLLVLFGPEALGELSSVARTLRRTADAELLHVGLRWWVARAWSVWRDANPSGTLRLHPAVRRAVELLRLQTETPLAQIAKQAGASLSTLRRQFRAEIGMSMIEFRTERRLERADALLSQARPPPLLTAALAAGCSYSQFYRAFVATRGVTPRRYYALPEE